MLNWCLSPVGIIVHVYIDSYTYSLLVNKTNYSPLHIPLAHDWLLLFSCLIVIAAQSLVLVAVQMILTSHMRLLFLSRSTCSGEMTLPVNGPISVPALIQVLEKIPRPSPGIELWAMITSLGSTRLESFWTSAGKRKIGYFTAVYNPSKLWISSIHPCMKEKCMK